ncbi:hypothetical protein [Fischerella sp. PCC 9605]|uniref:hypothetical protein n=1 Tax=Fischerella sp. PCC 9605 TaxID=1173024 RepID=UPI00047BB1BE|nr:hypothetical protein [Fischerella sp. PCC 9605]
MLDRSELEAKTLPELIELCQIYGLRLEGNIGDRNYCIKTPLVHTPIDSGNADSVTIARSRHLSTLNMVRLTNGSRRHFYGLIPTVLPPSRRDIFMIESFLSIFKKS